MEFGCICNSRIQHAIIVSVIDSCGLCVTFLFLIIWIVLNVARVEEFYVAKGWFLEDNSMCNVFSYKLESFLPSQSSSIVIIGLFESG